MSSALIFGASGQDGVYLKAMLTKQGLRVICFSRHSDADFVGDIADRAAVEKIISMTHPDYIFHFAANSTTRHEALWDNAGAIGQGTLNVLEAVRIHCPQARVFISGSAMQFDNNGTPISEDTPFCAQSPYSIFRIESVYAARYYRERFGCIVYVGYFFHHDSPLRTERHVNQKIAIAARRIAAGTQDFLEVGDLSVRKEFNFAGDIVNGIWILVNQNHFFEAVLGCGETHSLVEWTNACFSFWNLDWQQYVVLKKGFQTEYKQLVSNPLRLFQMGWRPQTTFNELAIMMTKGNSECQKL